MTFNPYIFLAGFLVGTAIGQCAFRYYKRGCAEREAARERARLDREIERRRHMELAESIFRNLYEDRSILNAHTGHMVRILSRYYENLRNRGYDNDPTVYRHGL